MIRIIAFSHFLLICSSFTSAQQIERHVTGSAGDSFKTSKAQLDWTLGEVAVEYYDIGQITWSEGFHQVTDINTGLVEVNKPLPAFSMYPNPVQSHLTVESRFASASYQVVLTDASGKKLQTEQWYSGQQTMQIDLSNFAAGMYLITIFNSDKTQFIHHRIIKSSAK